MKFAIVMTYFNRQPQLMRTLESFSQYNPADFFVVVVDDGSEEDIRLPENMPFEVVIIKMKDKRWTQGDPAYNAGFYYALKRNPDIVIIQNAECAHHGDILRFARENVTDNNYIAFGCYSAGKDEYPVPVFHNKGADFDGESAWYCHPVHRPKPYHFCAALTASNLKRLNGFDERFSFGAGYDDDYFLHQIFCLGLEVYITTDPIVIHQWHQHNPYTGGDEAELVRKNHLLFQSLIQQKNYRAQHTVTKVDFSVDLLLCTHYGFGDYVICYGLVKELAKRYDNITLFAIPHRSPLHIENVKRLYSSIKNVHISTEKASDFHNVFYLGFDYIRDKIRQHPGVPFPYHFYDQAGVPLHYLWDNFYFERDTEKEKAVYYDRLGLKDGEQYILLHDDPVRGFVIDRKYINPDLKILHLVDYDDISILDTLMVVENAKEVHCMTTGLVSFIDQMNIKHDSLNLHKYIRPNEFDQPILRLKWNIIEQR
jgi:glycosyltransferase involved in cell wall biosynthesis